MAAKIGTKRRPEHAAGRAKLTGLVLSSAAGTALLTGSLFLAAFVCLQKDASGWALRLSAYLCCALSALTAGCFAAKSVGKSGLLCGLLAAVPLCILLLILCLAMYGTVGKGFSIGSALMLFFGALGGIGILNIRHKRRYK